MLPTLKYSWDRLNPFLWQLTSKMLSFCFIMHNKSWVVIISSSNFSLTYSTNMTVSITAPIIWRLGWQSDNIYFCPVSLLLHKSFPQHCFSLLLLFVTLIVEETEREDDELFNIRLKLPKPQFAALAAFHSPAPLIPNPQPPYPFLLPLPLSHTCPLTLSLRYPRLSPSFTLSLLIIKNIEWRVVLSLNFIFQVKCSSIPFLLNRLLFCELVLGYVSWG